MLLYPFHFNSDDFKIKRKRHTSQGVIYPITYKDEPFIIQTPALFLPFGIKYGSIIDFSLNENDSRIQSFRTLLNTIEDILETTKRFRYLILRKSVYYSMSNFPRLLRLHYTSDICIFNEKHINIGKSFLEQGSHCKLIIHIKHVWAGDIRYGMDIKISQILCLNTTFKPKTFAFKDDTIEDERLSKYRRMLKMNIPLQAVKNKMTFDGLDPTLLDKPHTKNTTSIEIPSLIFNIKDLRKTKPIEKKDNKTHTGGLPFLEELISKIKK